MSKLPDPLATGPINVRAANGREVPGADLFWLAGLTELTSANAEPISRIAADGGALLADGAAKGFFDALAMLRSKHRDFASVATVFEDFEKNTYDGWKLTGTAFGKGPAHGTLAGQQAVAGFAGRGLVNTFIAGDAPQGTATSKPFPIERRYIGFLIGGGDKAEKTCINLRVGGKVVRTATGKNRELLEPASWNVADLKGKQAVIEIVDRSSEPWGHINIDQIIFSDAPPEPLLQRGTAIEAAAMAVDIAFDGAEDATLPAGSKVVLTDHAPAAIKALAETWNVTSYTRLRGFRSGEHGYRALATTTGRRSAGDRRPVGQRADRSRLGAGLAVELGKRIARRRARRVR